GRYDGLAEELGGPALPSLGFAMGLERILLLMEKQGCEFPDDDVADIYIATMGEKAKMKAIELCKTLRDEGFSAVTDYSDRGIKAQMKYANKIGAKFSIVIGDNEIDSGKATLKNMLTGENTEVEIDGDFVNTLYKANTQNILTDIENTALF
ncbi:MAG: histidine--tRNA ligase, partial [Clostridia bacterium]|nr:histidine--tRNA ligase [Clostridia bacterium]